MIEPPKNEQDGDEYGQASRGDEAVPVQAGWNRGSLAKTAGRLNSFVVKSPKGYGPLEAAISPLPSSLTQNPFPVMRPS